MGGYVSTLDIQESREQIKKNKVSFDDNTTIIESIYTNKLIEIKEIGTQTDLIPKINFNIRQQVEDESTTDISELYNDISELATNCTDDAIPVKLDIQLLKNRLSFLENELDKANNKIKTLTKNEIKYIDELDELYIENQRLQTKYNCLQLMHK